MAGEMWPHLTIRITPTFWVEVAHVPGEIRVEGADLDLVLQSRLGVLAEEKLVQSHVEDWNHLL